MTADLSGLHLRACSTAETNASHELIDRLTAYYNNKTKLNGDKRPTVKCSTYSVPGHLSVKVRSWKFDDFAYGKEDKPLPTNARGLFSYTNPAGRHEIVIRGYDKFFNTDQVHATKWSTIAAETKGPYDLTLKQNGCIIFIGALPDSTILVTSKHSLGPREDMAQSHAERGRMWLQRHLAKVGKTEEELASLLVREKLTFVCELCDDEFEEHILGYPPEKSGLYLHGINRNVHIFSTYPIAQVNDFAKKFGFLSNAHLVLPDLPTMRQLLDECAKTGTYEGTEVEGFVVRTKMAERDFFFKYKFEEPYLMFRQWREVTKAYIGGREPRFQKHQDITKAYLSFIAPLVQDPETANRYKENHGIIALRERFLQAQGGSLTEIVAKSIAANESANGSVHWSQDRFVIVPVATIGCGKTTMAVALQKLFGFGHVQNDNILGKKPAQQFAKNVYGAFETSGSRVVIADRNNHMLHERSSLMQDLRALKKFNDPPLHFIALSFTQSVALPEFTKARVLKRGDNHQSIRAATMHESEIFGIMNGFHSRFQRLDLLKSPDAEFCAVVEVDPLSGSRVNLENFITFLLSKGVVAAMPSAHVMDDAISAGMNYSPTVYKHMTSHPSQKQAQKRSSPSPQTMKARSPSPKKASYYGLAVVDPHRLRQILDEAFAANTDCADFWTMLKEKNLVQTAFHVTLVHAADKANKAEIWAHYGSSPLGSKHEVELKDVVYDQRVMAIIVKLGDTQLPHVNNVLHITIGTASPDIRPFEANKMLKNKATTTTRIPIETVIDCELRAF